MDDFNKIVTDLINEIEKEEQENIKQAASIIYKSMKSDGILHVFATGHSHMFCEELFYRSGGLAPVDPILVPVLMQHEGAIRSTKMERLSGFAKEIYSSLDLQDNEPFIVVSNSGVNRVPVEMAKIIKDDAHPLIVITSLKMSKKLLPKNDLNLHLYELGDVVIDNHVPYGDGTITKPYALVGSVSSILASYIAQRLVLEIIKLYEQDGLTPPIYQSANIPGGDEFNKKLFTKYQKRIKCLY